MLNGRHFILAVAMLACAGTHAQTNPPLVQPQNLTYLGSFNLPTVSGYGFTYGGTAIAHNPANNSLFVVGHVYDQETAEVSIPGIGGTATLLQPLSDSLAGRLGSIGGSGSMRIGGNLVYKNRLYTSAFVYYDGTGAQSNSHFSRPLTLNQGTVTGAYRVGSMGAGFYSGYMGLIPAEWQARFGGPAITGNCCLSVISRTSFGPAAFVFDPENTSAGAQPLVYYTQDHQTLGTYGASGANPVFNGTTRITGVVFPEGTSSVLFVGMTGTGNYCYGEASACGDPSNSSKGEHAYPYKAYIWAYNANDLLAVKSGSRQPWSVVPYATWELSQPRNVASDFGIGGATYDPKTKRMYISQKLANGDMPLVYVYEVNNSTTVKVPEPPASVSVQ